ncbi:hypothetical protein [uncultured Dokdonia sp.]|uniref:hypothetical protein n=1 Tax=uncultured Dokdonia sp. TaxID=575653 RepID=UPI00262E9427|nr:hypothetical protein [uncultured Dokdonia sp.]
MKKILFLLLFLPIISFSQGLDFETTNFEIKAVTLTNTTRSLLSYDLKNEEVPTKIKKFDTRSRQEIYNASQSFIYTVRSNFKAKNKKNPVITIAPLGDNDRYAFGDNGTEVKNIAYKPSTGGTIFSAYCAGVYAANNARN